MTSPQSVVLKLNEAKEFISKVQEAEKIYQKIHDDVAKYRWFRIPGISISEQENFLDITECDVEHLNLEPFDDQVEKYKWAPKYTKMALPRALSLRYNVCLSYAYDKNILMQLAATKILTAKWGNEDFLEAQKVLKEWITSKKIAYQVLHDLASEMKFTISRCTRGKHVLNRRCVKIFDSERVWFEKKLKTKTNKTPEKLLELMCNGCKQFALKSDELMNQLAPHFRTILREYYSDPEVADKNSNFVEAAKQCENILQNYLSFKVTTKSYEAHPDSLKSTMFAFLGHNKSEISIYDPNKYPDNKGLILYLILSFGMLVNRCNYEWCKDDRLAPRKGSVIHHALRYNLAEFDIFYDRLIEIIGQNVNVSTYSIVV